MKLSEVYDIETIFNLFTYTSYVVEEDKWYTFVIHQNKNQAKELYKHLTRKGFSYEDIRQVLQVSEWNA